MANSSIDEFDTQREICILHGHPNKLDLASMSLEYYYHPRSKRRKDKSYHNHNIRSYFP